MCVTTSCYLCRALDLVRYHGHHLLEEYADVLRCVGAWRCGIRRRPSFTAFAHVSSEKRENAVRADEKRVCPWRIPWNPPSYHTGNNASEIRPQLSTVSPTERPFYFMRPFFLRADGDDVVVWFRSPQQSERDLLAVVARSFLIRPSKKRSVETKNKFLRYCTSRRETNPRGVKTHGLWCDAINPTGSKAAAGAPFLGVCDFCANNGNHHNVPA